MRLIDADDFGNRMYHEVFEKDTDMQKCDSGCWMRYKLFENVLREQPTIEPERNKGKWTDNGNNTISCPFCNTWFPKEREPYMFCCPYCFADMRKE